MTCQFEGSMAQWRGEVGLQSHRHSTTVVLVNNSMEEGLEVTHSSTPQRGKIREEKSKIHAFT